MDVIKQVIAAAGSQAALAKELNVTPGLIYQLLTGRTAVSVPLAVKIERKYGHSRRALRPKDWGDIWPELIDATHPWPPTEQPAGQAA